MKLSQLIELVWSNGLYANLGSGVSNVVRAGAHGRDATPCEAHFGRRREHQHPIRMVGTGAGGQNVAKRCGVINEMVFRIRIVPEDTEVWSCLHLGEAFDYLVAVRHARWVAVAGHAPNPLYRRVQSQ